MLQDRAGQVLIAQRPAGKIAAGKWEFPGGKIEANESVQEALDRELQEELGVGLIDARPLIRFTHAYSDRVVTLDTWLVSRWSGEPVGRESQQFEWHDPESESRRDLLPTVAPILRALALPSHFVFTPPDCDAPELMAGLAALPSRALLRIRLPALDETAYENVAATLTPAAQKAGLRVVLDRGSEMAIRLGADGVHLSHARLMGMDGSAGEEGSHPLLRFASCHDRESLDKARTLGFDAAILGTVQASASHPDGPLLGWPRFSELAGSANLPVYAIGGAAPADLPRAYANHAQGVAGISAYWSRSGS